MTELEFVDDWSPLKEAVNYLAEWAMDEPNDHATIDIIVKYVPLLIEQYSKLLELSFTLTEAWDAANQNRTPGGLIVEEFKL